MSAPTSRHYLLRADGGALACPCERKTTKLGLTDDLQASTPEVRLGLSRAGVTGVSKAVRIAGKESETVMAATIDCTVDLAADQKGVHMFLFPSSSTRRSTRSSSRRLCSSRHSQSTSRAASSSARKRYAPR